MIVFKACCHFNLCSFRMAVRLRQVKLRHVGDYLANNFKITGFFRRATRWRDEYQAKYVTNKNAGIAPAIHFGGFAILVNYMIDYKYHLKYEKMRKYH